MQANLQCPNICATTPGDGVLALRGSSRARDAVGSGGLLAGGAPRDVPRNDGRVDVLKHGFARGAEPAQFVDRIQRFLKLLEWQPGMASKLPPASVNPDATWVGRPAA